MIEGFRFLKGLGYALTLDELSDLTSDRREHLQEVIVRRTDFTAKEFDHSDDFRPVIDREREGAMHAFIDGRGRAREILIASYVHDPCGSAAGPNSTGESFTRCKGHLSSLILKLWHSDASIMPKCNAAKEIGFGVRFPHRPDFPAHALANGLKDFGRGVFQRGRL